MNFSPAWMSFCAQAVARGDMLLQAETPLSTLSTLRIGGIAAQTAYPCNTDTLCRAARILYTERIPFLVIGNASNLLFCDTGFAGVILVTRRLNRCFISGTQVTALCGASLPALSRAAEQSALSGLEFAAGIPATLGGAVYQNAGAFGASVSELLLESIAYCPKTDRTVTLTPQEHAFSYRHSAYSENGLILLQATLTLTPSERTQIAQRTAAYAAYRKRTQPLGTPSAGSTFLRMEGAPPPAALIEQAGLKGTRIGGAQVSEKHAGFLVNCGGATATDVLSLISLCKREVYAKSGISLLCEIEYATENKKTRI